VKNRATLSVAAGLALALFAAPAMAQQTQAPAKPAKHHAAMTADTALKQARPGLLDQATVKPDSARTIAMGEVPGGTIAHQELRQRSKTLVYDFRITPSGGGHSKEVLVDAKTGEIVHLGAMKKTTTTSTTPKKKTS
jgi:uncharacterized membrane protein YkoI